MSYPFPPKHSMHWRTSPYTYEQAVSEYDSKGHLLDLTEKPNQASDDQAGSPPEHSVFWQGHTEPKDPVTREPLQWIEIRIVDEFNQPLDSVVGKLTDTNGTVYPVRAARSPIYVQGLAAGQISLRFDNQSWFECVEKRKPNLSGDDPVKAWLNDNPLGKRAAQVELLTATAGDFVELTPNQSLAERHHAGQADDIALETGNSYLIRIQGFNYITLRIGVFFDGTANNRYAAEWGKAQLDAYAPEWKAKFKSACQSIESQTKSTEILAKDLPHDCFIPPLHQSFVWPWSQQPFSGSAANEPTNVQKLHDLYFDHLTDPNVLVSSSTYFHKLYITGIGTGNDKAIAPADESIIPGQALGTGEYGVLAKVERAIEELFDNVNDRVASDINNAGLPLLDGINEVVFDVFGFSRGAAAARHFVNIVSDGEQSALAKKIQLGLLSNQLKMSTGFNWQKLCWRAGFVGVFDTVASVVDIMGLDFSTQNCDNGGVRLWLDPKYVDNAVHLTAEPTSEYRENFSLNKLNIARGKADFLEVVLPGSHSDIGGGYHARGAQVDDDYLLPLLENITVARAYRMLNDNSIFEIRTTKNFLAKQMHQRKKQEAANYWPVYEPEKYFTVVTNQSPRGKRVEVSAELKLIRVVEGDLSRLYLRLMFGLAQFHGVLFNSTSEHVWNQETSDYYHVQSTIGDLDFGSIAQEVLELAKQGVVDPKLTSHEFHLDLMRNNLIHHSASTAIGMGPNKCNGRSQFVRKILSCNPGE